MGACLGVNLYTNFRGQQAMYTASADAYLTKTLEKCWKQLDFLNTETEGGFKHLRQAINQATQKKASKKDAEYIGLLNYKKDKEEEEKRRAYGAVVSEFSDLSSVSEYKELVSSMMEFSSVDDLKEKLYAIRGKTGIFKKKENDGDGKVHIPVNFSATDPEEESAERKFYKRYAPSAANK